MALVHITFDFEMLGYGWSESWYQENNLPTLKQIFVNSVEGMAVKRARMLGGPASLIAASVSFATVKGDSFLRYLYAPGAATVPADNPHATIYTICRADQDRKRKAVFIRGQGDECTIDGGKFNTGFGAWVGVAQDYFNSIVQNGWGWVSAVSAAEGAVTQYNVDAITGDVLITTSPGFFPDPTGLPPQYHKVRIRMPGKSKLDGVQIVQATSTNECVLAKPLALFPFTKAGTITRYDNNGAFYPAENYDFQKSGVRRCGRPKLHTPGHRSALPRG